MFIITPSLIHMLNTNYTFILTFAIYIFYFLCCQAFLARYIYMMWLFIEGIRFVASASLHWFICWWYSSYSLFVWMDLYILPLFLIAAVAFSSPSTRYHLYGWGHPFCLEILSSLCCTLAAYMSLSGQSLAKWANCLQQKHLSLSLLRDLDAAVSLQAHYIIWLLKCVVFCNLYLHNCLVFCMTILSYYNPWVCLWMKNNSLFLLYVLCLQFLLFLS